MAEWQGLGAHQTGGIEGAVEVTQPAEGDYVVAIKPENHGYWKTSGLKIDMGASRWCKAIAQEMLAHIKATLPAGKLPDGGSSPPLAPNSSRAKKAAKGKRPRARAFTEHRIWIRSLVVKSLQRGKRRASCLITTSMPEVFGEWLERERSRGVDYFPVSGDMKKVMEEALARLLKQAARKAARGAK